MPRLQHWHCFDQTGTMLKIIIIVLNVALLLSIAWRIVMREDRSMRFIFWSALGFKFLCGILLGLLYTYYYSSGDTFVFFQDGSTLSALARDNVKEYIRFLWSGDESFFVWNQLYHSQYRSLFFTKLISAVSLITIDNYWIDPRVENVLLPIRDGIMLMRKVSL